MIQLQFDDGTKGKTGKYKVQGIWDSAVHVKKLESHLPDLNYLVSWKNYSKEENIWEPISTVQYLWKLISILYKKHPEKPTAISLAVDSALPIVRPIIMSTKTSTTKQKQSRLAKSLGANEHTKSELFSLTFRFSHFLVFFLLKPLARPGFFLFKHAIYNIISTYSPGLEVWFFSIFLSSHPIVFERFFHSS